MTEHYAIVHPNLTIVAIVTKLQDLVIFSLVPEEEEEKGPGFQPFAESVMFSVNIGVTSIQKYVEVVEFHCN